MGEYRNLTNQFDSGSFISVCACPKPGCITPSASVIEFVLLYEVCDMPWKICEVCGAHMTMAVL